MPLLCRDVRKNGSEFFPVTFNQKGALLNFPYEIIARSRCSRTEQVACVSLVSEIVRIALKARREGILSLEREIGTLSSPLLSRGIRYVSDGVPEETVKELLYNHVVFSGEKGRRLRRACLIAEGVVAIQEGLHFRWVLEKLGSMLPDAQGEMEALLLEIEMEELELFSKGLAGRKPLHEQTALLEEWLPDADQRSVELLLREAPVETVAMALAGAGGRAIETVFRSIANRGRILLMRDIEVLRSADPEMIAEAQKRLLAIAQRIEAGGR